MEKKIHILMLEDTSDDAHLIERELRNDGVSFISLRVETEESFVRELKGFSPDLILADYSLPSYDGMSALQTAQACNPEIPFILVSGAIGEEKAIEAFKSGLTDYIFKGNLQKLGPAVRRALLEVKERNERKQAEEALKESEKRYREIINNSPMGIYIYKLEDDGSLVFKGSNPAADALTRTNNSELIGKTIEKAFPSLADTETPDMYRRVASDGIPWNTEEIYYNRGVFEVQAFQSGPGMVTVIFSNITDRKSAEKERLANEKLQGVLETAGAVCHELNQPLQVLFGFSELLSIDLDEDNPLCQRINKIKEQIDRIATLTRKFTEITRYKSKPYDSNTKILDLDGTQERRKYKRHIPRIGAFVSIESDSLKQIPVIDISKGGLAFHYYDRENQLHKSGVLTLSVPDENLNLEKIPYNIISGYSKTGPVSSNHYLKNRVGLQFNDLNTKQLKQVVEFFKVN